MPQFVRVINKYTAKHSHKCMWDNEMKREGEQMNIQGIWAIREMCIVCGRAALALSVSMLCPNARVW